MNSMYGQAVGAYSQPTSGYPVGVAYPRLESYNRFYAIPILGFLVKSIMLIPYFIVWYVLALVTMLLQLVVWIPVLFTGQYPSWGMSVAAGFLRYHLRLYAFHFGLTDRYPSFSLQDEPGSGDALLQLQYPQAPNRFFAIPIIGYLARYIMLIPHIIVLYVINIIVGIVYLVSWIPVLLTGQYPDWGTNFVGGSLRWQSRVIAYALGLTEMYPPFQLAE